MDNSNKDTKEVVDKTIDVTNIVDNSSKEQDVPVIIQSNEVKHHGHNVHQNNMK